MQIDRELIKTLVLKELSGNISLPEAELLNQMLNKDIRAYELAEEIRSKVNSIELNNYLVTNDKEVFAQSVLQQINERKKKRRRMMRYVSVSAAASLIVFFSIWYFSIKHNSNNDGDIAGGDISHSNQIVLYLPGGSMVELDSTKQRWRAGNVVVSTQSNILSYNTEGDTDKQYASLLVPAGKDYKINLEDGTEIHLNAATKLRFPLTFKGESREISIDGEAYLKVAHNTEKPFIVHLPNGTAEVLGTEFNVNTYDSTSERISLVTGSLKVNSSVNAALLKPGMEAVATAKGVTTKLFDADEVLAWRQGKYYIDNATLAELSTVLSRWYGCTISVDTKEAAIQRFTGVLYRSQPVEHMLRSIQLTNTVHYSTDEKGIIHIR